MKILKNVIALVEKFDTSDIEQRTAIREDIRSIGPTALPTLNMVKYRLRGEAYVEVNKTIVAIGDDLFAIEGKEGLDREILKTINSNAEKIRQYAPEEVFTISVEALTRWGFEIPQVLEQKILSCHVCGKKSTELRIKVCGLHFCDIKVCKNDAHIISTRFGQFNGTGGKWFCTEKHRKHANHNHIDWN